jgi:transglutaminase-like putative cysteine protease
MNTKSQDGTPVSFPSSGYQTAKANADGTCTVVINLDEPQTATAEEISDPQFLAKTALCDGSDAAVVALAKEAVKNLPANASTFDRAEAMRSFVHRFITNKGYGNAFASASQVARDPSGDCSEHGVLLCGLLRASGIPSRGVMGVVYISPDLANFGKANGVFGWHFWSQALIDGKWVDFDATLPEQFNVGHIASSTSALQSESVNADMVGIMALIGNTDIEVVKIGK